MPRTSRERCNRIADVAEVMRPQASVLFLVDAAQSAGHLPIDLREAGIDILACPGHKGVARTTRDRPACDRAGIEHRLHSLRQGAPEPTAKTTISRNPCPTSSKQATTTPPA